MFRSRRCGSCSSKRSSRTAPRSRKSNVALYPAFQAYFREHKPRFLAAWGRNDPFFLPAGAEGFKRDMPDAVVRFFDTGHFALETHAREIAAAIRDFLSA